MSRGLLPVLFVLAGCLVGNDLPPETPTLANQSTNKLALNKLALNKLALNKLALNKLALNSLSGGVLVAGLDSPLAELESADTFREADGRSTTMIYVARCLVPAGQTLEIAQPGGAYGGDQYGNPTGGAEEPPHAYAGSIGIGYAHLEPDGSCGTTCQEWMTACLLAHVNALGVSVSISLRGPDPVLVPDTVETADYLEQEAGFYGNLFVDQDPDPEAPLRNIYACTGWLWDDAEQVIDTKRLCGRPAGGGCDGIQVVGYCGARLPGSAITPGHACAEQLTDAGGTLSGTVIYRGCHRSLSVEVPTPGFPASAGPANAHVITTHLQRRCNPERGVTGNPRCDVNGLRGTCVGAGTSGVCQDFQ